MTEVRFYDSVSDELLKFAVIISKTNSKWVFCKHKERNTYEIPGGHRENEDIIDTARRELYEETGALRFDLKPICIYSVTAEDNFNGQETIRAVLLQVSTESLYLSAIVITMLLRRKSFSHSVTVFHILHLNTAILSCLLIRLRIQTL